jgi:hypothetical protein
MTALPVASGQAGVAGMQEPSSWLAPLSKLVAVGSVQPGTGTTAVVVAVFDSS